jgi:hypothetical protein
MGTPEEARAFCARFGEPACLSDPQKASYKAMGLEQYNLLRLFSDKKLAARRRENRAAGFKQDWRATRVRNAAQLPGAAFFDAGGTMRWVHRGAHPGDLPPMRDMLYRVRQALTDEPR